MTRAMVLAALLALTQFPAQAADWNVRPWDQEIPVSDVRALLQGSVLEFPDGGISEYADDGSYAYVYSSGRRSEGVYEIHDDGSVCVDFENGWSRCDLYVRQGDRLVLITEDGQRFPLK